MFVVWPHRCRRKLSIFLRRIGTSANFCVMGIQSLIVRLKTKIPHYRLQQQRRSSGFFSDVLQIFVIKT